MDDSVALNSLRVVRVMAAAVCAVVILSCPLGCQTPPAKGGPGASVAKTPPAKVPAAVTLPPAVESAPQAAPTPAPAAASAPAAEPAAAPVAAPDVAKPIEPAVAPAAEGLATANAAAAPEVVIPTPSPVAAPTSAPVVFANAQGFSASEDIGALSADVRALMELVRNVSAAVSGRTEVVERVVEKPVERVVEKVVDRPVERVVERVVEKPVEKIVERVVEKPMDPEAMIKKLDKKLTEEIADRRSGLRPYLAKASLCLLDSDCRLQDADLALLSPEDRSVVEEYRTLFSQLGQQLRGSNRKPDRDTLVASAQQLSASLGAQQKMGIAQALLCRQVNGFGMYDPFAKNEFRLGEMPKALVYTELDNFKARRQGDGQYAVKLIQELSLYRAGAVERGPVWSEQPVQIVDLSRNRRRDFFLVQFLRLPETLDAGEYELQVKVSDLADGSSAVSKIPVRLLGRK